MAESRTAGEVNGRDLKIEMRKSKMENGNAKCEMFQVELILFIQAGSRGTKVLLIGKPLILLAGINLPFSKTSKSSKSVDRDQFFP